MQVFLQNPQRHIPCGYRRNVTLANFCRHSGTSWRHHLLVRLSDQRQDCYFNRAGLHYRQPSPSWRCLRQHRYLRLDKAVLCWQKPISGQEVERDDRAGENRVFGDNDR